MLVSSEHALKGANMATESVAAEAMLLPTVCPKKGCHGSWVTARPATDPASGECLIWAPLELVQPKNKK